MDCFEYFERHCLETGKITDLLELDNNKISDLKDALKQIIIYMIQHKEIDIKFRGANTCLTVLTGSKRTDTEYNKFKSALLVHLASWRPDLFDYLLDNGSIIINKKRSYIYTLMHINIDCGCYQNDCFLCHFNDAVGCIYKDLKK